MEHAPDMRDEAEFEQRELRRKITVLNLVIEEGDTIMAGLQSKFWEIFSRTLRTLQESYKSEAYEACKSADKNIGPFLGRMEMIDHIFTIMEGNFVQGRERAITERETVLTRIKELQDIIDSRPGASYTGGTGEA